MSIKLYNSKKPHTITKIFNFTARGKSIRPGGNRLVVHACIFNSDGEVLIQQRQSFKDGWPNKWDVTVGGRAIAGDDSGAAIERELFEELGLKINLRNRRPHLTVNFNGGFDDISDK